MVEEIAMTFVVGHAAVVRKRAGFEEGHDDAGIGPGASRRGGCAVRDMLGHATGGIQQLIGLCGLYLIFRGVDFAEPGALGIVVLVLLALFLLVSQGRAKAFLRHVEHAEFAFIGNHVAVQLQVIDAGVTPHEPRLSVVVDHHRRVDMIPRAVLEQRFAKCILEGTGRRV